ncbi:YlbF family regulator [Geoglobus acetivorans]|uniref:YlbF family regulator n=1 Tax=Geoglobus acetivorans TaxID=565033 RepID=A0A0A7GB56_GEOAI|nr:hypothetical protein GACE_0020 [Geoglobus acetivorans]MBE8539787.1 YlbF family regulator [Geoglobus acetivorans]
MNDVIRDRAIALAKSISESEEYREFIATEEVLKQDEVAQNLLIEFQEKQQEFLSKQLMGEVDEALLNSLTEIQGKLNELESVRNFMDSYNRLVSLLGEVGDLISQELDFDFGEAYRT